MKNKNNYIFIIVTIVFICLGILTFNSFENYFIKKEAIYNTTLKGNDYVEQDFISKLDNIDLLNFQVSISGKKISNGRLKVELFNQSGKLLKSNNYKLKDISDNSYVYLDCNLKNTHNKKYKIKISALNFSSKEKIGLSTTKYDEDGYDLDINGKRSNHNIIITEVDRSNKINNDFIWYCLLYISIMFVLITITGGNTDEKK